MYNTSRPYDYGYAAPTPAHGYGVSNAPTPAYGYGVSNAPTTAYGYRVSEGNFNSYPAPARGVVGDLWRRPSIDDRQEHSYEYGYKDHKHKQGTGEFSEHSLKNEIGKLGGEFLLNEVSSSYGHSNRGDHYSSGKHGAYYVGSMTQPTNDIAMAMKQLKDAATQVPGGSSGYRHNSKNAELESLVNYYPAMHSTMDPTKRYGSFSLASRRSSFEEPAKYD